MMRLELAAEPHDFEAKVWRPGMAAIAKLVEAPSPEDGRGRRVFARPEDIPPELFPPLWRMAKDDLLKAYHRICAYSCLYIHELTGSGTTDHFVPKSRSWEAVYKWTNYRLACGLINTWKGAFEDIIDPTSVVDGMFAIDLDRLIVVPGPCAGDRLKEVEQTIARLHLDGEQYRGQLGDYYHAYHSNDVSFRRLEKCAPFLASEMKRQGKSSVDPKLAAE